MHTNPLTTCTHTHIMHTLTHTHTHTHTHTYTHPLQSPDAITADRSRKQNAGEKEGRNINSEQGGPP